jgi:hypothetical protein
MSGSIIPTPNYRATNWQSFGTQIEKQRLGFIGLSLTNYDNNLEPQIAAGSCVEIAGAIFQFTSNGTITGTPSSDNINYIMLEVSGSGDSQIVEAKWTTDPPTWNTSKQGWYDATNIKRYVGGCYYNGTYYYGKKVYGNSRASIVKNLTPPMITNADTEANVSSDGRSITFTGNATAYLGVILPDNAVIVELYSYVGVQSEGNIIVKLYKSPLTASSMTELAKNTHTGVGALVDTSIISPVVDNSANTYFVLVTRSVHTNSAMLVGIRIKYLADNM